MRTSAESLRRFGSDVENPSIRIGSYQRDEFQRRFAPRPVQLALKRAFDVVGASLGLAVLAPFLLLVALAVKLSSPGPVLFKQVRCGRHGRLITVLKFRSMYVDACDASGINQTIAKDPRVTRVGAWLRASNVDELPQLWNVLVGDMSLIGPRCHVVGMLAAGRAYEELVHNYHLRHAMRPGITGLAQVRGLRGPTTHPSKARQRIASDLYYVENFSIFLDAKILFLTIKSEVFGGTGF